ncbi:methionine/alanine import family NSS transporter small subunit [Phytoactinopolyspora limicola]|uniref:methionine/alanine import family NSS transporter small subunit n=1 Tax=Phytoactinopolyspora limicola TaxID=2715536 RepID=UPI00140E840F|nr:methionine/alanine import family NSS transporter small subunit [Phytoactinopolyspora limicola]
MSGEAIVMLVVSVLVVWGGLITGIVVLRRHPDEPDDGVQRRGHLDEDTDVADQ